MSDRLTAPPKPCGSCPYRRDVPSGIWEQQEYDKLPAYDRETWEQPIAVFMCHQRDGSLCGGWLACHDTHHLLALRIARNIHSSVLEYETDVPVFASGAEARDHGMRDIVRPGDRARKMIAGLERKRDGADPQSQFVKRPGKPAERREK